MDEQAIQPVSWTRIAVIGLVCVGFASIGLMVAMAGYRDAGASRQTYVDRSYTDPAIKAHYRAMSELAAYMQRHGIPAPDLEMQAGLDADQLKDKLAGLLIANPDWTGDALINDIIRKSPQHYYVLKQGGHYGYSAELTDFERERGLASKPLVMFTPGAFSGPDVKNLVELDGPSARIISCRMPCTFATAVDPVMGYQTYQLVAGTVMWAAFQDDINGKMTN